MSGIAWGAKDIKVSIWDWRSCIPFTEHIRAGAGWSVGKAAEEGSKYVRGNDRDDPFLSLKTSFPLPVLIPSLCPLPRSCRKQSLIQSLACDRSFWVEIPGKRSKESGRVNRAGGKGNTRVRHWTICCCGQLRFNPPGPSAEHPSCHSELSLQGVRRAASTHQFPPAPRPPTVKTCHMGCQLPCASSLCMPEQWVDSWAESWDRCGNWGTAVSGYICVKVVAAAEKM